MKAVVAVLCISMTVVMGQEVLKRWEELHHICQADPATFVDESIFEGVKKGDPVELPPNFGAHVYCMTGNLNIQDANGNFNKDITAGLIGQVVSDPAKVSRVVDECAVVKGNREESAVQFLQCLDRNEVDIGQSETY